jgi:methyl-accepting chemotaxis protein
MVIECISITASMNCIIKIADERKCMTISRKILLGTLPFFLVFGLVLLFLSISSVEKQGDQSLEIIHSTMLNAKEEKLTDLVRNTFEILRSQYQTAHDTEKIAKAYENELQSVVNLAFSSVQAIYDEEGPSLEEKQAQALKVIKTMRYAGDNYLWINDMEPTMIMHPMKPALDGNNLSDFKDPNGKHLFIDMVKVCQRDGQGFVDYMWPKPGEDKPVAKLSFVRLFKPWNWVIGSGVYLETAEKRFMDEAKTQISNLRFGPEGKDYFFIIDTEANMVMHPIDPSLNNKSMKDFRDPKGKTLFQEMVQTCQKSGQGFVNYLWPKPGEAEPAAKLSYVQLFKEWGWIVGTGIYIDDIDKAMAVQKKGIHDILKKQKILIASIVAAMVLLVGGLISFLATRITRPIRETDSFFRDIAQGEGDLTGRLSVTSNDELGDMAKSFNTFADKLQGMIGYIAKESVEINNSSSALRGISSGLSSVAEDTLNQSTTAASAVEEMSANMHLVAASMEDAAANVNAVASAIEEMTSTINEIAETSEKARTVTDNAVTQSANASVSVGELGTAAREITKVLETISEISQQVDLLALNATIEAARAGDAGKGFAVVASEIKDLAKQTALATDQIKERIESIQKTTQATVAVIADIGKVVGENSEIVNTIATAVEEQSVTAREISENVAQISISIQEVNTNIAESSSVSQMVAEQIAGISTSSKDMNDNAQQVNENSHALNSLAQSLDKLVSSYKFK